MSVEFGSPNAETNVAKMTRTGAGRAGIELFLISFLILFLELTCIRWFGSTVLFLTFFTNIVLMACFLGVSVGCLAARRRSSWMAAFIPLSLVATASVVGLLWAYNTYGQVTIEVGTRGSPQLIYFGTEPPARDPSKWVVPIEGLAGYFFVLIALLFVGPGQELGRRFAVIDNRVLAYSADILGSLTGIAVFALMSSLRAPPVVWFLIALALGIGFIKRRRWLHVLGGLGVIGLILVIDRPGAAAAVETRVFWSPYYQVQFKPRFLSIDVNNLGHQGMLPMDRAGSAYLLPHLLNRDAGGKPFEDVLIIGAGSGNDVAAALSRGVGHVDAVEIDPVINELGRTHHPNRPYSDRRVSIHLDDGRGFLRKTTSRYDLISYALVDSLALHSSYSSVRLESFLFTEQAFRDVKARLKPGGVFAMYNYYRRGWVVGRLAKLAETVFGTKPIVMTLPYQETVSASDSQRDGITFLLVGDGTAGAVESIRSKFASDQFYWLNFQPQPGLSLNMFGATPPLKTSRSLAYLFKIGPARVDLTGIDPIPTDDWPFLYLRDPMIPAINLRGMAIVAVLSIVILLAFAPIRRVRPSGQMFFLGAGFMLLETKGVVHMALLFGATWMVNSIVFFAILTMILLSNLYVLVIKPRRLWPCYALLLATLAVNSLVPMDDFLALPGSIKVVASCVVVFMPVFFAGLIFATSFGSSSQPEVDLGSNIGGIILGGLSEYLSLILGFNHLIWIAIGYYVLSALFRPKTAPGQIRINTIQ